MAKAPAPEPSKTLSLKDMDKPTKIKFFASISVLFLAVVWIIIWFGVLSGDKAKPPVLSPEKEKQLIEENKAEQAQHEAELKKSAKPGRPLPPPKGS